MNNNKNFDEIKLTGRIYPAIQSCVQNRYYILIGIFTYYAFILGSNDNIYKNIITNNINIWISILFFLITILNGFNYIMNSRFQILIEEKRITCKNFFKYNITELISDIIILLILGVAYFIIPLIRK